jgi:aspartate aminotransferase-like enzyme
VQDVNASAKLDLSIVAPEGHRSPTVTAIALPPSREPDVVIRGVAKRGFTIGSGYGRLKATTIRIGHMGDHTVDGVARCLDAVAEVLHS